MRILTASLALAALLTQAASALAAPEGRWYATQLHAHSRHSDGLHSVADLVRWAREGGLDALALTDHQTERHVVDPDWQAAARQGLIMIPAYEWTRGFHGTWDGGDRFHLSVWGLKPGVTPVIPPTATREEVLTTLEDQGLTVGANHPFEPRFPWPDDEIVGVHAMEVWQWRYGKQPAAPPPPHASVPRNSLPEFAYRNGWAIDLWRKQLAAGRRVAPLATADFHVLGPQQLESPCTLIWSREATAEGILAGIRAGRVVLVREPHGPRVELEADADHDGEFEAMVGDSVPAGTRLRVRATGARGLVVALWRADGEVGRYEVREQAWARTFTARAGAYFARADRPGGGWDPLQAMTGAVYVTPEIY